MADQRSIQRREAYRLLRPMLLHGQIPGGTRLGEVEWAAKLGVHRGALREAFGLLLHEGLLAQGERGGHFAPTYERADLDEILELRAALEVAAVRRLCQKGGPVDVEPLRAMCRTMRQLADSRMPLGFAEADRLFHERIIESAGNRRMARAYLQGPIFITAQLDITQSKTEADMARTIEEHEQICDQLEAGRYEDAARCLEQHLLTAHSVVKGSSLVLDR
ncbi:MAG: GntR family transcriptional regulator [Phycisphaeraceae bacterium]|nr:GntR family transcriptional regulator [Phycisphaeraceae bacterium]